MFDNCAFWLWAFANMIITTGFAWSGVTVHKLRSDLLQNWIATGFNYSRRRGSLSLYPGCLCAQDAPDDGSATDSIYPYYNRVCHMSIMLQPLDVSPTSVDKSSLAKAKKFWINGAEPIHSGDCEQAEKDSIGKPAPVIDEACTIAAPTTSVGGVKLAMEKTMMQDFRKARRRRVPRLLVPRKLICIDQLEGEEFISAWLDCCRDHFQRWSKGVQLGHVYLQNLVYDSASKRGLFIDLDVCVDVTHSPESPWPSGIGTHNFRALDLFYHNRGMGRMGTRHYRHHLESFIWMLPFVLLQGSEDHNQIAMLNEWKSTVLIECLSERQYFLLHCDLTRYKTKPANEGAWKKACAVLLWLRKYHGEEGWLASSTKPADTLLGEVEGLVTTAPYDLA